MNQIMPSPALRVVAVEFDRDTEVIHGVGIAQPILDGDAVERLVAVVGVQRGQSQMAGFGEGDRMIHSFAITDFANQNHVVCLPQGVLQRSLPVGSVGADFALCDDAVEMRVHEFDRIFDRQDMRVLALIDMTAAGPRS